MPYICMCFGWYQELLEEVRVDTLAQAEAKLIEMLEEGGMIVHAYRDIDLENPELVGRHGRFRSFVSTSELNNQSSRTELPHEVERFLLDRTSLDAWNRARKTDGLLEDRWSIVELWSSQDQETSAIYGKAVLIVSPHDPICGDADFVADTIARQYDQR